MSVHLLKTCLKSSRTWHGRHVRWPTISIWFAFRCAREVQPLCEGISAASLPLQNTPVKSEVNKGQFPHPGNGAGRQVIHCDVVNGSGRRNEFGCVSGCDSASTQCNLAMRNYSISPCWLYGWVQGGGRALADTMPVAMVTARHVWST